MRGKTYEEAIAEQRKMPLEHLLLGRGGKDKNKDKKPKKVGKKVKEKPAEKEKAEQQSKVVSSAPPKAEGAQKNAANTVNKVETVSKTASNAAPAKATVLASHPTTVHSDKHRAVEFGKPEAEFVSESVPQDENNKPKKKKKVEKGGMKPILLNRDEVSPVDVSAVKDEPETPRTANHFEESKPKDEFLKRKHSEEVANPAAKPKEKSKAPVVEKAQPDSSDSKVKVPVVEKEQAKHVEKVGSGANRSSTPVQQALLSGGSEQEESNGHEVSNDVNNQAPQPTQLVSSTGTVLPETKRKKKKSDLITLQQMAGPGGVNVSLLEPLIQKAELSRSEVQNLIDLLLNKQQESAVENAEWSEGRQDPIVKLKKQLAEREKALAEEQEQSQGWQVRVRELRAELNGERTRLGANVRKLEGIVESLTTKIQNENESHASEKRVLLAQVQEMQTKLSEERRQACKMQEQENVVATLQQELLNQRQQMEVHMARLSEQNQEKETGLKAELTRLQEEVKSREESRVVLQAELHQVREELSVLQASSTGSEEERSRLRELVNKAEAAAKVASSEANAAREMARRTEEDSRKSCNELEKQVAELKAVTSSLKMRETELQAEVNRVKEEANTEKNKLQAAIRAAEEKARNAEEALARVEADKVTGGQAEAELQSNHQRLIQEKESFIQQLSNELTYYKTEIPKLSDALELQRKKNDEESQKAIMEEQEAVKQLLQRLLPNVAVEGTKSHSEWMKRFETSACEYLQKSSRAQEKTAVCEEHEKEIERLQARVSHYLAAGMKTESILNELQNSVEEREAEWSEHLKKKEAELKQVSSERDDLVATLEELQGFEPPTPSTETQEKVQELESRLAIEEEEKQKLTAQCDNLQRVYSDLEKELSASLEKVEQLQKELNSLSQELSTRQEKNEDLSKEVVRLNSLIKIGQASLSQEQLQVKEMEEELEKLKVQSQNHTATNGPASESSISEGGSAKN